MKKKRVMREVNTLNRAQASLKRIQNFEINTLERAELGDLMNFKEAIPHAKRLVSFFQMVSVDSLAALPEEQLSQILDYADAVLDLFEKVLSFDGTGHDRNNARTAIISRFKNSYQNAFHQFMPFVSHSIASTIDFARLQSDSKLVLKDTTDQIDSALNEVEKLRKSTSKALKEIKQTAAELGVSQQAVFFKNEAKRHVAESEKWRKYTRCWAIALIVYGGVSFFLHKIPFIAPTGVPEAINFVASKILVFAVLTYMLILSARNFLSHKHNAVVNKHRQNALSTFRALVEAGQVQEAQDIVLSHAASCIFTPQDTGYIKHSINSGQMPKVADVLPKSAVRMEDG